MYTIVDLSRVRCTYTIVDLSRVRWEFKTLFLCESQYEAGLKVTALHLEGKHLLRQLDKL